VPLVSRECIFPSDSMIPVNMGVKIGFLGEIWILEVEWRGGMGGWFGVFAAEWGFWGGIFGGGD